MNMHIFNMFIDENLTAQELQRQKKWFLNIRTIEV